MSIASVKSSMEVLKKYMNEISNYGVWDSEPLYVLRSILRKTREGLKAKVPSTAAGWQIYKMEGSETVAQNLHNLMTDVVNEIGGTTVFESNSDDFKRLFFWIN